VQNKAKSVVETRLEGYGGGSIEGFITSPESWLKKIMHSRFERQILKSQSK